MSWGIAETAPEIEKIKAESADYLGGLNSCGEIEWGIYSQAFDFYADLIQKAYELGKTEAKPHWIPVEHDLPKENYLDDGYVEPSQPVLVYMNYHTCKISRYWGHRKSKGTSDYVIPDWMDLEEYDGENVIAWCELPEPYKGVTDGRD